MIGRIVRMERYGGPEVLATVRAECPELKAHELRIRTRYAGVNYTDLQIRAGAWPLQRADPFPYVPGVEVVGEIDAVGSGGTGFAQGQSVMTMMQGLGGVRAERDGGYAQFVTVAAEAVAALPDGVDLRSVAALGLPGVTAWKGLSRLGAIAGGHVLVTGAAGSVGAIAVALAAAAGAHVTGLVVRAEHEQYVRALGACDVIVGPRDGAPDLTGARFDGVLDVVGGYGFRACVSALQDGGTLCLVGAVGGGDVMFDAWNLIRPVTLTGYSTETLDGTALRSAVEALCALMRQGRLAPPPSTLFPLDAAADAHLMFERGASGRLLLTP
jgi:NADPH2:quinone reductase